MMHACMIIAVAAVVTAAIRFAPFLLFDRASEPPKWIAFLGDVLPPAVMSVLILYCIRSESLFVGDHAIPELTALAVAVLLHLWKRNTLISICVSTALYMVLVQMVFAG